MVAVLTDRGYIISSSGPHAVIVWPPGTDREQVRAGRTPIAKLTAMHMNQIQETAQTEEDVLISVASIAETGAMPDPLQRRIEEAIAAKDAEHQKQLDALERRIAALLDRLDKKAAQKGKGKKAKEAAAGEEAEADEESVDPAVTA